jgi:hypothetical protein
VTIFYEWIVSKYEIARARQIVAPISAIPKSISRQKNAGEKNKNSRWKIFIFLSGIFLSGLFWENAIPKADRSPDALIASPISNRVIQELTPLAVSGTPLGYLTGMIIENRRDWSSSAMAPRPVGGS